MNKFHFNSRTLAAWTICIFQFAISNSLLAAPIPKITSVSPEWVQRGVTTDIVIMGENLSSITEFAFSGGDGLSAEAAPPSKPAVRLESTSTGIFSTGAPSDSKRVTVKLAVSADTSLGMHEMRVITPGGVSNPLQIRVTDAPEIYETGNNHSVSEAPKINLPAGIAGKVRVAEQVDFFRFGAKKGERLLFDVQANRMGSPLDSSLALLDSTGKELARNEDANGFDSFLDFTVPADGDYILTVRDFQMRGGDNYNYHIIAGPVPYLKSIFPFGGQRGKTTELSLSGINLEGAEKMSVTIDANAPGGPQEVHAYTTKGISNPMQFDVSAFADFMEKEPNSVVTNATEVTLPGNINGHIAQKGDVDVFKFKIEKSQRLIFEIYARRFASKLDPLLVLTDAKGNILQRNDDAMGADARIDQTFSEPGDYFISVRDLLDRGGEDFGYRISADPPAPADFGAKLLIDTVRLNRGGRMIARVEAIRSGFGGPMEIIAENLPEGVSMSPLIIPADFPTSLLQLNAAEGAELGTFPLELKAVALLNGKREVRAVQTVTGAKSAPPDRRGRVRKTEGKTVAAAYLTILEGAPFGIDWLTLSAGIDQNQSTKVLAEVQRKDGYKGDVKVSVEGYSAGNEAITRSLEVGQDTAKGTDTRAEISMKAKLDSETGARPVYARAEATVDGLPVVEYSRAMPFRIGEFPFTLANSLPRLGVTIPAAGATNSAASEAEFSVTTQRRGLFSDDIAVSIEGLPEGINTASATIARGTGDANFKLTVTDKAKVGTNTIAVVGVANVNGRQFRLRGPDIQFIVNAPVEGNETAAK